MIKSSWNIDFRITAITCTSFCSWIWLVVNPLHLMSGIAVDCTLSSHWHLLLLLHHWRLAISWLLLHAIAWLLLHAISWLLLHAISWLLLHAVSWLLHPSHHLWLHHLLLLLLLHHSSSLLCLLLLHHHLLLPSLGLCLSLT